MKMVPHECIKVNIKWNFVGTIFDVVLWNRAIAANYTPLGQIVQIGNLPVYEYEAPNNQNKNRMLVGVYDIYGFAYENLKQVIDEMAVQSGGFRAILPKVYKQ